MKYCAKMNITLRNVRVKIL